MALPLFLAGFSVGTKIAASNAIDEIVTNSSVKVNPFGFREYNPCTKFLAFCRLRIMIDVLFAGFCTTLLTILSIDILIPIWTGVEEGF